MTTTARETSPVNCSSCPAGAGEPCISATTGYPMVRVHASRTADAADAADLETCSECLAEVPDSTLREWKATGERLCRPCYADRREG